MPASSRPPVATGSFTSQRSLVSRRIRDEMIAFDPQGNFLALDGFAPRVQPRPGSVDGMRGQMPGLQADAGPSPELILQQVAGQMLPGSPSVTPAICRQDAERLVELAKKERLLGPLLDCVDSGVLDLSETMVDRLVRSHRQAMRWCLYLERRLLEVADWFSAAGGVEFLVIKGPAVAHLDHCDPGQRSFNDLDLLVHGRDMDRAIECLERRGALRRVPERRPGFDRRFIKSVGLVCADGVELDIHRSFSGGAHGFRIRLDRVFDGADTFAVGGVDFKAPNPIHRALHASYHAVVGSNPPPLRTLRDLAGYLVSPDVSPELLVAEARRWRCETVLAEAVRATLDTLSFDANGWDRWLDDFRPDPAELAIIRRGHDPRGRPIEWTTIRELAWRDRAAFAWAVALPSKAVLEQRGATLSARIVDGSKNWLQRR